ncbi:MAG: hypothetical protein LBG79_07090 [Spirochaetaceae bacterium]|nr:hypothetical protein [Spirochaetaceae bacterium]
MTFWYNMTDSIKNAAAAVVIAGGLIGIFSILFFSIFKIKQLNATLAIIIPVFASCILMVPVISSFNNLVDSKVEGNIIDEAKIEIKARRAEADRLKAENKVKMLEREKLENQIKIAEQTIEMEALKDNVKLLENAQLSMRSFEKILEVALLQANLKQTLVRKERISAVEQGIFVDNYYDEVLVVITHDLMAKYGIDLNKVKITRIDGNTAVISGIKSKFIGTSRNVSNIPVREIREVNFKKGAIDSIKIKNDTSSNNKALQYAETYENEFQRKLSEGVELNFMDEAVIQLAQNFIRVMFAPLYKNIRFDNAERVGALPLPEYLDRELKDKNDRIVKLSEENINLETLSEKLDTEAPQQEF